jgi:hypothetical protein
MRELTVFSRIARRPRASRLQVPAFSPSGVRPPARFLVLIARWGDMRRCLLVRCRSMTACWCPKRRQQDAWTELHSEPPLLESRLQAVTAGSCARCNGRSRGGRLLGAPRSWPGEVAPRERCWRPARVASRSSSTCNAPSAPRRRSPSRGGRSERRTTPGTRRRDRSVSVGLLDASEGAEVVTRERYAAAPPGCRGGRCRAAIPDRTQARRVKARVGLWSKDQSAQAAPLPTNRQASSPHPPTRTK